MAKDVELELGWGRLIFGQTFADSRQLVEALRREGPGRRDICIYARESHVVVAEAPTELFIDPSHTYRLRFTDSTPEDLSPSPLGVTVRTLNDPVDADAMNRVYVRCGMVPAPSRRDLEQPPARAGGDLPARGARRRRRRGGHRHRCRSRAAVLRPRARLEPVDAGRRSGGRTARNRCGPDPGAGRALPRRGSRLHGPVGHARQRRRDRASTRSWVSAASRCWRSSARMRSTSRCSARRPRRSTTSTPTRGSSPTRRCAAESGSRCSTPRPARCDSPTAAAAWSPVNRCPSTPRRSPCAAATTNVGPAASSPRRASRCPAPAWPRSTKATTTSSPRSGRSSSNRPAANRARASPSA